MAQRYQLSTNGQFLDPRWFNSRAWQNGTVTVGDDRTLVVQGVRLRFLGEPLAPGTEVIVSLSRNFYCETVAERLADELAFARRQAEEKELYRLKLNRWRDEAIAVNARINLPVEWAPAIKDVLSGLQFNSMGDGRNRRTVQHILLKAELNARRLKRRAGDFLCTSASGTNGMQWSGQKEEFFLDGEGKPYPAEVTCKACLRLAERFKY